MPRNRRFIFDIDFRLGEPSLISPLLYSGNAVSEELVIAAGSSDLTLKPALASGSDYLLYEHEIRILYKLDHPNIVRIVGYSELPTCVIMKRFDFTLQEVIKRGEMSYGQALILLTGMIDGFRGMKRRSLQSRNAFEKNCSYGH
jgi:serine/threonine protein kinase